jgi:hypothetical protein
MDRYIVFSKFCPFPLLSLSALVNFLAISRKSSQGAEKRSQIVSGEAISAVPSRNPNIQIHGRLKHEDRNREEHSVKGRKGARRKTETDRAIEAASNSGIPGPHIGTTYDASVILFHSYNNLYESSAGHAFDVAATSYLLIEANSFSNWSQPMTPGSATNGGHMFDIAASSNSGTCSSYVGRSCIQNNFVSSGAWQSLSDAAVLSTLASYKAYLPTPVPPSAVSASVKPLQVQESSPSPLGPPQNLDRGSRWTGATACSSPYACSRMNAYNYKCL